MQYVTYDEAGNLTGLYRQDVHPTHASRHFVVDDAVAADWPHYRMNAARSGVEAFTPTPTAEAINAPILARLRDIDMRSIRALREGNTERITALESEAAALRMQLVP